MYMSEIYRTKALMGMIKKKSNYPTKSSSINSTTTTTVQYNSSGLITTVTVQSVQTSRVSCQKRVDLQLHKVYIDDTRMIRSVSW